MDGTQAWDMPNWLGGLTASKVLWPSYDGSWAYDRNWRGVVRKGIAIYIYGQTNKPYLRYMSCSYETPLPYGGILLSVVEVRKSLIFSSSPWRGNCKHILLTNSTKQGIPNICVCKKREENKSLWMHLNAPMTCMRGSSRNEMQETKLILQRNVLQRPAASRIGSQYSRLSCVVRGG